LLSSGIRIPEYGRILAIRRTQSQAEQNGKQVNLQAFIASVKDETFGQDYTSCGHTEKTLVSTIGRMNTKAKKRLQTGSDSEKLLGPAREEEELLSSASQAEEEASEEEEESSEEDEEELLSAACEEEEEPSEEEEGASEEDEEELA
jgi:hypothetical protein